MAGAGPDPSPCLVTFFADYAAAAKHEMVLDLDDLVRRIRTTTGPTKAALPWLKLARFGDARTAKGSLRHDGNMLSISGIEADYDDEVMSVDEAVTRLGAAGVLAVVYTSPSHTPGAPRWRVLCPLSQEYTPDERDRFLARLNGLFGGVFANESWTRSQSYYYGSINANPAHRVEPTLGTPIDLISELDMFAQGKPEKPKPNGANGAHHGPATPPAAITDKRINGLIQALLDNIRNATDGTKYFTLRDIAFTIGGYLHLTTWSEGEAVEACVAALPSAQDWDAARKTAAAAIAAGALKPLDLPDRPEFKARTNGHGIGPVPGVPPVGDPIPPPPPVDDAGEVEPPEPPEIPPVGDPDGPGAAPPLPTITCQAGELPRMVREAEEALLAAGTPIYQRSVLVRPAEQEYPAADGSTTHSAALVPITSAAMLGLLSRVAIWQKWDGRVRGGGGWVTCDPPTKVVDILLANRGEWSFPVVRGVLTTPTIRPDGSLLKDPGYDEKSRYYLMFPSDLVMPDIPETPTLQDAIEALGRLEALLVSYPFVKDDGVSKSVALAILMTQVLRCGMTVSPLLAVSATAPGSGKSHLVDLASTIAIGRPCPIMGAGKNDEETEKGINTHLISGVAGFSIDNVHRMIDLAVLNIATERPMIGIRLFGTLDRIEVENSTTIYMTGNNLPVVDEQVRRTVLCSVDANEERPEQRDFDSDPIATVRADRGRYIADVLIIALAYLKHGSKPAAMKPFGSYPGWSKLVREPLIWLGHPDPVQSQDASRASDPEVGRLRSVIGVWLDAFGLDTPTTLADAVRFAMEQQPVFHGDPYDEAHNAELLVEHVAAWGPHTRLRDVLVEVWGRGKDIDTGRWGHWMKRYAGRIADGLMFQKGEASHSAVQWRLVKRK